MNKSMPDQSILCSDSTYLGFGRSRWWNRDTKTAQTPQQGKLNQNSHRCRVCKLGSSMHHEGTTHPCRVIRQDSSNHWPTADSDRRDQANQPDIVASLVQGHEIAQDDKTQRQQTSCASSLYTSADDDVFDVAGPAADDGADGEQEQGSQDDRLAAKSVGETGEDGLHDGSEKEKSRSQPEGLCAVHLQIICNRLHAGSIDVGCQGHGRRLTGNAVEMDVASIATRLCVHCQHGLCCRRRVCVHLQVPERDGNPAHDRGSAFWHFHLHPHGAQVSEVDTCAFQKPAQEDQKASLRPGEELAGERRDGKHAYVSCDAAPSWRKPGCLNARGAASSQVKQIERRMAWRPEGQPWLRSRSATSAQSCVELAEKLLALASKAELRWSPAACGACQRGWRTARPC